MVHRKFPTIIFYISLLVSTLLYSCGTKEARPDIAAFSDLYLGQKDTISVNEFKPREPEYLVIHCTAIPYNRTMSKQWFLNFFKYERGWDKPGYQYIVAQDGKIDTLIKLNCDNLLQWHEVAYGVAGINSISINISYQGGVDKKLKPMDTRTQAQKESINKLILSTMAQFPKVKLKGHNEFANKACPSFSVSKEYKSFIK